MAEIVQEPQLRYTTDQLAIAEMLVQFPALKAEDPPATLKVVGWGNLAQTIQEGYHVGDRVIVEGRLGMNTIDRPEGFKEKRAELTIQKIHRLEADAQLTSYTTTSASSDATASATVSTPSPAKPAKAASAPSPSIPTPPPPNFDEIPF
jgi:single-strand DNA-binding protein